MPTDTAPPEEGTFSDPLDGRVRHIEEPAPAEDGSGPVARAAPPPSDIAFPAGAPVADRYIVPFQRFLGRRWPRLRWPRAMRRLAGRASQTDARRQRTALIIALALNAVLLTILGVFGRVTIFVPNRPAQSIAIVLVNLPQDPLPPDLRSPEAAVLPEPPEASIEDAVEPEEIEIVEPELKTEPEPVPMPDRNPPPAPKPEPEPEPEPEPQPEPEPDPRPEPEPSAPVLDLTPENVFAPPRELPAEPLIPDPASRVSDHEAREVPERLGQAQPADDAPPLVAEETSQRQDGDDAADEAERRRREAEAARVADEGLAAPAAPTSSGDDAFDEEPSFAERRFIRPQMALPGVDLPSGDPSSLPGQSGVVAIFCPEEFRDNREKAAECAGRPEIRSGWRPGSSGESWDEAVRLLKAERDRAGVGDDSAAVFGPDIARRMERQRREENLGALRRGPNDPVDALSPGAADPAAAVRPDIGPDPFDPSWSRRDAAPVSQKDIDRLMRELDEADRRRGGD